MKMPTNLSADLKLWHARTQELLGASDYQDVILIDEEGSGHRPINERWPQAYIIHRTARDGRVLNDQRLAIGNSGQTLIDDERSEISKAVALLTEWFDSRSMTLYVKDNSLSVTVAFSSAHKQKDTVYKVLQW